MFCAKCGKPLDPGATTCGACGAPVAAAAAGLYAGFWRRGAAYFMDGLVLLIPAWIIGWVLHDNAVLSFVGQLVLYWLYTALIVVGSVIILIPHAPLVKLAVLSQVLNGILLPFVLVFMLLLVNKQELVSTLTHSRIHDLVDCGLTGIIVLLAAMLLLRFRS